MAWLLFQTTEQLKETIMSALDDTLNQITGQLAKAREEILTKLDELEAALAANQPPAQETLDALRAAAQSLDDVIPDQPPAEEPPAEPTP